MIIFGGISGASKKIEMKKLSLKTFLRETFFLPILISFDLSCDDTSGNTNRCFYHQVMTVRKHAHS